MRIIDKNATLVRSLTPAEKTLLIEFVEGVANGPQLLHANQWLMRLRSANHWLACDCRNDALPVLNASLNGHTGTLFLRNNPDTPAHAAGCPFSKSTDAGSERSQTQSSPAAWLPPDTPLRLLGDYAELAAGAAPSSSRPGTTRDPQRLLSLLLTWIEASGLNVYTSATQVGLSAQYATLRTVASRYPLIARVPASNYLETRLDMKHQMMLKARLRDASVFGSHRRHGLLLDCIDAVEGRRVLPGTGATPIDFHGNHQRWGGTKTPGPLLGLAVFSPTQAHSQFYRLIHVASVPVLSRSHLFPVYRDEERAPLKALVSLIDWMASKGVKVTLRRPVIGAEIMDELIMTSDQDRVLSVSLLEQPLGPEPETEHFKRYADFKSPETFRKYVAGFFMRER